MITWMQRHKKWLIITIWISTIAFVGAGFVGWGQYSYGNKAGAVAKVGNVEITNGELQKTYSRLYAQYNQMFQGNFDEEKAKQFGLDKQALQQLIQQALLINLAQSYDLIVSDEEMIEALKQQKAFYKNGAFDKETYKLVLSQNRLSIKEYETELRKELLIQKTLKLLPVKTSKNEENILNTIFNIADKINYKVLTLDDIQVSIDNEALKKFWQKQKNNFMNDVVYEVNFIKVAPVTKEFSDTEITTYYKENRTHFKGSDGKILPLEAAKEKVLSELNAKAMKDKALRTYIAFKKNKLQENIKPQSAQISKSNNPFNVQTLDTISKLALTKPYTKPININGTYYIFELTKTIPAKPKSFEEAKAEILPLYITQMKKEKLMKLVNDSVNTFIGRTSDFLTVTSVDKLAPLSKQEAADFLQKLFVSDKKRSSIALNNGKVVLYNILEQKLLTNKNNDVSDTVAKLKNTLFNEGLIKTLQNKYQTEIYIQGL
ncbi:peptidylprolyl isomerase [Sulfurimonas sp. SWIR-19]|uniref:peptidylprolyl isomerase n=1 Tax=Sulfurimonas sp. SWIR-19 TaxID=2878390 RepID=UPI001CF50AD4|nr:peptidylprolyl isomerase [Sulfurimonas sp. SWIR-19]UCM99380.1 peptidylprolyl isomerase [Sulfurimonas sp. SWIR-19]